MHIERPFGGLALGFFPEWTAKPTFAWPMEAATGVMGYGELLSGVAVPGMRKSPGYNDFDR